MSNERIEGDVWPDLGIVQTYKDAVNPEGCLPKKFAVVNGSSVPFQDNDLNRRNLQHCSVGEEVRCYVGEVDGVEMILSIPTVIGPTG